MNIKDAKSIPLSKLLEHLGARKSHDTVGGKETWYFSPFRPKERTASFRVNHLKNSWYDFGHSGGLNKSGSGGDTIDLWCDLHSKDRRAGIKDALAELSNLGLQPFTYDMLPLMDKSKKEETIPRLKILKTHKKIFFPSLKDELSKRKISEKLANLYLKQVYLQDTEKPEKKFNGLAIGNNKGGIEISIPNPSQNKNFKTSTEKSPTTILGGDVTKCSIFEGFWDFLSWLELNKISSPPHTCFILNSVSFVHQVALLIQETPEIKFVASYLDNDEAGYQATHDFALALEQTEIIFADMSNQYQTYKDLSDFWTKSPAGTHLGTTYGRKPIIRPGR